MLFILIGKDLPIDTGVAANSIVAIENGFLSIGGRDLTNDIADIFELKCSNGCIDSKWESFNRTLSSPRREKVAFLLPEKYASCSTLSTNINFP